ncbi:Rieske 2Fe-2S domain-containing protein [Arthrobacter sp. GCM10027362]|uniref:Rieske 2Fe-2S domain-containing protein n=1 Tax=Arthrobacter sp. GCM10027362 TaxID=3273379 RepID=UPI0036418604
MNVLHNLVERLERLESLDKAALPLRAGIGRAVRPRIVRNLLSGTALGHALHPVLTDLPIGAWSMAALLDTAGPAAGPAADLLVTVGIAAAIPTAAAGLNDWSDTRGPESRVGLAHAAANSTALSLYAVSLVARRSGHRRAGRALALAGFGVLMAGGYLGGYLGYAQGVKVNRTAWRRGPAEWTSVLAETELAEGQHRRVRAGEISVLLVRDAGRIEALDSVCSHMGGPLEEGTVANGCVTCPWHGSTFRLTDGNVVRGPASNPQPSYETRLQDGQIQLRARTPAAGRY